MTRKRSAAVSLVVFLGFSGAAYAQRAATPTLDEILKLLQGNLDHYDRTLPNLFCDEHVVSKIEPDLMNKNTVIDSVFRVQRVESPDHRETLAESRELKEVDGKPAASQPMRESPSLLSGAFEGGFAVVSLDQKSCMRYSLQRIHGSRPDLPYVINFATAPNLEGHPDCLLKEKAKGRIFVDPNSIEIRHLEVTTPRHVIVPGDAYERPVIGKWVVTINYSPVVLDGDTFWLPATITSTSVSGWTTWSFRAGYRNYHRMEVKSRILPGSDAVTQ